MAASIAVILRFVARLGRFFLDQKGLSLVEALVVSAVMGAFVLILAQTVSSTSGHLRQLQGSLGLQDVEVDLKGVFSEISGSGAMWRLNSDTAPLLTWGQSLDFSQLSKPFFSVNLTCVPLKNPGPVTVSQKIRVDAIVGAVGPQILRGQTLKGVSSLKVSDVYLLWLAGADGNCPPPVSCRSDRSCIFQLNVEIASIADAQAPTRRLAYPMSCRTRSKTTSVEEITDCRMMGAPAPDPSPSPSICVGDVNQDGQTDRRDLELVEAFYGYVPVLEVSPESGLYSRTVDPMGGSTDLTVRWEPYGNWTNPVPAPTYSPSDLGGILRLYTRLNVDKTGEVGPNGFSIDGGDLGKVIADLGCKTGEPPVCFEDADFYPLIQRLGQASAPFDTLTNLDTARLQFCSSLNAIGDASCLALNLDGKCGFRDESSSSLNETLLDAIKQCRPRVPEPANADKRIPHFRVITAEDTKIGLALLRIKNHMYMYRHTKPGSQISCEVRCVLNEETEDCQ